MWRRPGLSVMKNVSRERSRQNPVWTGNPEGSLTCGSETKMDKFRKFSSLLISVLVPTKPCDRRTIVLCPQERNWLFATLFRMNFAATCCFRILAVLPH
jgi:hypothetical protein